MRIAVLILLILLGACSAEQMIERLSSPDERSMALRAANTLETGDYDGFDLLVYPPARDELTIQNFRKYQPLVPRGRMSLKSVAVQASNDQTIKSFNYEVGSGRRWALVQITLRTAPTGPFVIGYRIWQVDHAPTAAGELSLKSASAIDYCWILAMTLALGLTLTALVQIIRTHGLRLKWLWALGSLLSLGSFQLQWGTGAFAIQPLFVQLFGVGVVQPDPFSPFVLQFGIPVVAIVFLILKANGRFERDPLEGTDVFN